MLFNSATFLGFFAVVLALHYSPMGWRANKLVLLLASYLFYAAWNPPFVILIWISTWVDWHVAKGMARAVRPAAKRGLLLVSLGVNLGLLGFFKYGDFLLQNFTNVAGMIGIEYVPPAWSIVLPVGISFYTFQTLSYTIDVYRGSLKPWHSFLDFALFVTFFPQLVAGPIVRASEFLPQLVERVRATVEQFSWGLTLLVIGLFEKVVLADSWMAPIADDVYSQAAGAGLIDSWIGTLAFSAQIFFDFAGYSTCAIGVALCLGFALPDNFRYPYGAIGFSDFWRRWHVSLSTWLRDYLYIPLGGNRKGPRRTQINLMLTMLLGGLWHGASWRFVAWGGLHGSYLVVERWLRKRFRDPLLLEAALTRVLLALATYGLVCITWVFFRAESFGDAGLLLQAMVGLRPDDVAIGTDSAVLVAGITVALLAGHWIMRDQALEDVWGRRAWWMRGIAIAAMLVAIIMSPGADRAFIYFQF